LAADRSALSVSAMRTRSRIDVPRTSGAIDRQSDLDAQQKKQGSMHFFIHRLSTEVIHRLSPKFGEIGPFSAAKRVLVRLRSGVEII
jgi:hypothetical protein